MNASAYTAFCSEGCTGKTRLGIDVSNTTTYQGRTVIAVDPDVIPLYSLLKIETQSGDVIHGIAADTGGAIDGKKIDVLVSSHSKAIRFGRQNVKVVVIREGR
ncbi:3D domain-containing protein [Metabacillus sp. Hm71]|uniref:3D domain-containing protein n=1 Tax=Metabacillus sp. Hm71 TaxID=3450743 RepID=UPI003F438CAF